MNAPSGLTLPVARASVPSNMSKTPPRKTTMPPISQAWRPTRIAPRTVIPKPIRVSPFGVSPSRPKKRATGSPSFLTRVRVSGLTSEPPPVGFVGGHDGRLVGLRHDPPGAAETEQRALPGERLVEGLPAEAAQRLAAAPAGGHDARRAELAEVPADERLGQADVLDELGHGRRAVRQPLDDPQPVDVGQRPVEEADLAQLVGLVDDGRDGRADPGGGGAQETGSEGRRATDGSTRIYINRC